MYMTGLAEHSFAKPETIESYFLSWAVTIQLNFVFHGIVVLKFWTIQLHGS